MAICRVREKPIGGMSLLFCSKAVGGRALTLRMLQFETLLLEALELQTKLAGEIAIISVGIFVSLMKRRALLQVRTV